MSPTQRREAERPVVPGVLVVADADQRALEQPYYRGEHLVSCQLRERDVPLHALTNERENLAERNHPAELGFVAHGAVARMVAVLLSSARVSRCDLQMPRRIRTDPHARPARRNHEPSYSLELRLVAYHDTVGSGVDKAAAATLATDPRCRVG